MRHLTAVQPPLDKSKAVCGKRHAMRQAFVLIALLVGSSVVGATPPWQRTESRVPCTSFDPLRAPYFGDLHIHTHFSADAYIFGTRVGPPDAYGFARGAPIALADDNEVQTRSTRLDRPLDFAAVTDHSEFFGEVLLCDTPGSFVYDDPMCQLLRRSDSPDQQNARSSSGRPRMENPPRCTIRSVTSPGSTAARPRSPCGSRCRPRRRGPTTGPRRARSRPSRLRVHREPVRCAPAPEHHLPQRPGPADGIELHRDRRWRHPAGVLVGDRGYVSQRPASAATRVIIPHNSNLSGGQQWAEPGRRDRSAQTADARAARRDPPDQGNSECRFDRRAGAGRGPRTSSARSSSWTRRRRALRGTRCRSTSTRSATWSGTR